MTRTEIVERLDCEHILKNKDLWALNLNEYNLKEEFEKISTHSELRESSFSYKILMYKLRIKEPYLNGFCSQDYFNGNVYI